jgi:glycosidase
MADKKYILILLVLSYLTLFCKEGTMTNYPYPDWFKHAVIYEVNVRQYTKEGTFPAFAEHLPRLKELGVDILWFMPIQPIGELNRKGSLGSYYSIKDYKAVNPEFGTLEEFKDLVKQIHDLGMYVLIDWVANHTAWDNELTKTNPEWFIRDKNGNFVPPVPDWTDVIDLDYSQPGLRTYMQDALAFWIEEADIDGYRCDVAGMVPLDFWEAVRPELEKIKPIIMLAEAEGAEFHHTAFDITYNWVFHKLFNAIAAGHKNVRHFDHAMQNEELNYPTAKNFIRMNFTSNHDENSWNGTVFERLGKAANVFAMLTYTLPGIPLIYSGQEAGLDKRLAFFEKDEIEWKEHEFFALYQFLNKLKNHYTIFANGCETGNYIRIKTSNDKAILAFMRQNETETFLIIANLSPYGQTFTLDLADDFTAAFTKQKVTINKNKKMNLAPWDYIILAREQK